MIEIKFRFAGDIIVVTVNNTNVYFTSTAYGSQQSTIEGLKLNKSGVIKEFPDLKDNPNWNREAIIRFKKKIKTYNNEGDIANYIMGDLKKFGYIPLMITKNGFRPEVIK
jgi:hypothetical protein